MDTQALYSLSCHRRTQAIPVKRRHPQDISVFFRRSEGPMRVWHAAAQRFARELPRAAEAADGARGSVPCTPPNGPTFGSCCHAIGTLCGQLTPPIPLKKRPVGQVKRRFSAAVAAGASSSAGASDTRPRSPGVIAADVQAQGHQPGPDRVERSGVLPHPPRCARPFALKSGSCTTAPSETCAHCGGRGPNPNPL